LKFKLSTLNQQLSVASEDAKEPIEIKIEDVNAELSGLRMYINEEKSLVD
jgi:hypothetical protein